MSDQDAAYRQWLPVIGRSLAHLCLKAEEANIKNIADKARFLEALGLDRKDVADMLGSTYASISELLRLAKNKKKGGKNNVRAKAKRR